MCRLLLNCKIEIACNMSYCNFLLSGCDTFGEEEGHFCRDSACGSAFKVHCRRVPVVYNCHVFNSLYKLS